MVEMAVCHCTCSSGHEVISFYNDMPLTSASHSFLAESSSDFPLESSCPLHVVGPLCEPAVALFSHLSLDRGLLTDSLMYLEFSGVCIELEITEI